MPNASQHSKYLSSAGEAFQLVMQVFSSGEERTKLNGSSSDKIAPSDVIMLNTGRTPVNLERKEFNSIFKLFCITN